MSNWLKNAVFYEIYPTSFKDSNSDGVGDLNGITSKLDYVSSLGFNAIWLNPFYKSPFKDGGYDVSDFFDVDPRFGTIDDFKKLLKKAHDLKMHVIVDLVAGHASEQNPDFLESAKAERNKYSDLFIWNSCVWDYEQPYRLISGRYDRNGCYMVNFFSTQPAFNFGFNEITHPKWQMSYKDERTKLAREYIKKIIRFWLNLGADGFRVDMADSLVKNDDSKVATMEIWKEISNEIFKKEYPEAILVSEWCNPDRALKCGFNCDFVLDHHDNFSHLLSRSTANSRGESVLNGGKQDEFKSDLVKRINSAKQNNGYLGIISGNHDTPRVATFLDDNKLRLFYMIIMTLPGVPFVYYGDEIGMKHRDLPSKDGGYQRTGDRTPMQWDNSKNRGFSDYDGELYLPQGNEKCNVEDQLNDKSSLLNYIKDLISFRKNYSQITDEDFSLIDLGEKVFAYSRNDIKIVINLSNHDINISDLKQILITSSEDAVKENKLSSYSGLIYR